jgi:hypothetical protein
LAGLLLSLIETLTSRYAAKPSYGVFTDVFKSFLVPVLSSIL